MKGPWLVTLIASAAAILMVTWWLLGSTQEQTDQRLKQHVEERHTTPSLPDGEAPTQPAQLRAEDATAALETRADSTEAHEDAEAARCEALIELAQTLMLSTHQIVLSRRPCQGQ